MPEATERPQASAAAIWPPIARFVALEARIGAAAAARGPATLALYEFVRFGLKQAWACLFGGAMLALIVATHLAYPAHAQLARYDFLFLAAMTLQVLMLATRLETPEEAKVICAFHVIGTLMEIEKTHVGSWTYPEASLFHIGGVPLFTGSCMPRSAPTSPASGGCSTSASHGTRRCPRC